MSDEDALLAALDAHPEDDAPLLIYADWLREQGFEAKADLIGMEVQARQGACPIDAVNDYLERVRNDISNEWLLRVFKNLGIVIRSYDMAFKISCVRLVRHLMGLGLYEAKVRIEQAFPIVLPGPFYPHEIRSVLAWWPDMLQATSGRKFAIALRLALPLAQIDADCG